MKQKYELGQKVFVFRTQKGEVSQAQGVIVIAEINHAGYVQYSVNVKVAKQDGWATDQWQANNASIALTQQELDEKINKYIKFNNEQKDKYIELFGAPEFSPSEIGLKQ